MLGFAAIRRRDIAAHRAWMIRGYALGLGAGTQVFTEGIGGAVFGTGVLAGDLAKGAAWAINLGCRGVGHPPSRRSTVMTTLATTTYEIRVAGHLDDHWSGMLGDLTLRLHDDGSTVLTGRLADQAELHGVLARVRDLGVPLLSLRTSDGTCRAAGARRVRFTPRASHCVPPRPTTPTPPGPTGVSRRSASG